MLDRSNEKLDRSDEMLDRSNDMLDRSNDMLDRSNKIFVGLKKGCKDTLTRDSIRPPTQISKYDSGGPTSVVPKSF
ncbi:hypothetical protein TNCV_3079151 [Trichonephila clavipes]|nr:hypothetical protein TNCV_3079151 [Trichonephila clavipes]